MTEDDLFLTLEQLKADNAALKQMLAVAEDTIKFYSAYHVDDCMWDWRGVTRAREAQAEIKKLRGE